MPGDTEEMPVAETIEGAAGLARMRIPLAAVVVNRAPPAVVPRGGRGAFRALRQKTLDMNVLVAVAVGSGWLYSLVVTVRGGGDVFYEAATVLTAFVLLGHWFEMRARGGANDAIRTLLDLAPPKATVIRGGRALALARWSAGCCPAISAAH